MPLGTEVGLVPCDIVLDGDPAPLKRGTAPPPHFSAHAVPLYRGAGSPSNTMSRGLAIPRVVQFGYREFVMTDDKWLAKCQKCNKRVQNNARVTSTFFTKLMQCFSH